MKSFDEQKQEIMDNFDWARVHKTMKLLKWTWATSAQKNRIPSIAEIKRVAEDHLMSLYTSEYFVNEEDCSSSSGGFSARKENGYLSLSFVVTDWDTNYE